MSASTEPFDESNSPGPGSRSARQKRYLAPLLRDHGTLRNLTAQKSGDMTILAAVGVLPPFKAVLTASRQWPPRPRRHRRL